MTHAPPPGEQRLYALDAAPAVAALAVVFQHWERFLPLPAFAAPIEASPLYAVFAPFYDKGARAVMFFFRLSGFYSSGFTQVRFTRAKLAPPRSRCCAFRASIRST